MVGCDLRQPQMAEQLAEVPTILYFLKQRIPEQIVDIPVPRDRGGSGGVGLLGFHPRQSSTALRRVEGDGGPSGGLQGFPPTQSSTSFRRVEGDGGPSGGSIQGFHPTQSSTAFRRGEDERRLSPNSEVKMTEAFTQLRVPQRFAVVKMTEAFTQLRVPQRFAVVKMTKAFPQLRVPQRFAVVKMTEAFTQLRVPQRFAVVKMTEDHVEVFKAFPQLRVQRRLAELKVEVFEVFTQDSFQPSHELIAATPAPRGDPRDFLSARGSEAIFGGGRPAWRSRC